MSTTTTVQVPKLTTNSVDIEAVSTIVWKQFCRYYSYTYKNSSNSNSNSNQCTELVCDNDTIQQSMEQLEQLIETFLNDFSIQQEIFHLVSILPATINDCMQVDDINDNEKETEQQISTFASIQESVIQHCRMNYSRLVYSDHYKQEKIAKATQKITGSTTKHQNKTNSTSFSLFSSSSFLAGNNSFISWDVILEENNTPNDIIMALLKVQYIDDLIPDWDDAIYPYLVQNLPIPLPSVNQNDNNNNNNNSNNKSNDQQSNSIGIQFDNWLKLIRKLFHLTRNNNEYKSIQNDIIQIVLTCVEQIESVSTCTDKEKQQQQQQQQQQTTNDPISLIITNGTKLLLGMFSDWTDIGGGTGSYNHRCFVLDDIKQQYGKQIFIKAVRSSSCSKTQLVSKSSSSSLPLSRLIIIPPIVQCDRTATWFYRWMNTLSCEQVVQLFVVNPVQQSLSASKKSTNDNTCTNSSSPNNNDPKVQQLTEVGLALQTLIQITQQLVHSWNNLDDAFVTTTSDSAIDTTDAASSTTTTTTTDAATTSCMDTEVTFVVFTLSIIRSIIVTTRVIRFPWSILPENGIGSTNSTTSTNNCDNNDHDNCNIMENYRQRMLLHLYCSTLQRLLRMCTVENNYISITDTTSSNTSMDCDNRHHGKTNNTTTSTSSSTAAIDICVDAMDVILSSGYRSATINTSNSNNSNSGPIADNRTVDSDSTRLLVKNQTLLRQSYNHCSVQYSYIAQKFL